MDVFLLDKDFNREFVIDGYSSFIWTERYNDVGEFEVVLQNTDHNRVNLRLGRYLRHSESGRLMQIRRVVKSTDQEKGEILTISGRSIEHFLDDRAVYPGGRKPSLTLKGTLGSIITQAVAKTMMPGQALYSYDAVDNFTVRDNTTSTVQTVAELKPRSLLETVKELCEIESYGFSLMPNANQGLTFRVYEGERKPDIVFSAMSDSIMNETYMRTDEDYKNIAYVWPSDSTKFQVVTDDDTTFSRTGMDRRVINVDANDINPADFTDSELIEALKSRGREELAKHKRRYILDAEMTRLKSYEYITDYRLGDIVTFFGEDRVKQSVQITEHIWTEDENGYRSYPTYVIYEE